MLVATKMTLAESEPIETELPILPGTFRKGLIVLPLL